MTHPKYAQLMFGSGAGVLVLLKPGSYESHGRSFCVLGRCRVHSTGRLAPAYLAMEALERGRE